MNDELPKKLSFGKRVFLETEQKNTPQENKKKLEQLTFEIDEWIRDENIRDSSRSA
jgi:hypothetical protein